MKRKMLLVALITIIVVVLFAACAQQAETPDPQEVDVKALINERCSACHPARKAFDASLTAEAWSDTIDDMVKKGADVSDEEKTLMIDWFTAQD